MWLTTILFGNMVTAIDTLGYDDQTDCHNTNIGAVGKKVGIWFSKKKKMLKLNLWKQSTFCDATTGCYWWTNTEMALMHVYVRRANFTSKLRFWNCKVAYMNPKDSRGDVMRYDGIRYIVLFFNRMPVKATLVYMMPSVRLALRPKGIDAFAPKAFKEITVNQV